MGIRAWLTSIAQRFPRHLFPPKSLWSTAAYLIVVLTVISIAWLYGPNREEGVMNVSLALLGTLLGYLIGVTISPYSFQEKEEFSTLSKAVSLFISGYLLGKIDKLLGEMFTIAFFSRKLQAFRFVLFFLSTTGSLVATFVYRKYVAQEPNTAVMRRDKHITEIQPGLHSGMTEDQVVAVVGEEIKERVIESETYKHFRFKIRDLTCYFRFGVLDNVEKTA
jgi:hypothetical protein